MPLSTPLMNWDDATHQKDLFDPYPNDIRKKEQINPRACDGT